MAQLIVDRKTNPLLSILAIRSSSGPWRQICRFLPMSRRPKKGFGLFLFKCFLFSNKIAIDGQTMCTLDRLLLGNNPGNGSGAADTR